VESAPIPEPWGSLTSRMQSGTIFSLSELMNRQMQKVILDSRTSSLLAPIATFII
jgi:hypothetical protein